MQQTWHIFKKDVRYLQREIILLLALALLLCELGTQDIAGGDFDVLGHLIAIAAAFTIARLIHAEAIPGENQFWITRPYRWQSLLAAKLLFILAFINLPIFLAQTGSLLVRGFPVSAIVPGLLWTQALVLICVVLPLGVLAALTEGLARFVSCILAIALLAFVPFWFGHQFIFSTPESLEWLGDSVGFAALALFAPPILYLQYKLRRTSFARTLAISLAVCGAAAYLYIPWQTLFPLQARLSRQTVDLLVARAGPAIDFERDGRKLNLKLPVAIRGLPDGAELQIDSYAASLETVAGRTFRLDPGALHLQRNGTRFVLETGSFYGGPVLPKYILDQPHQQLTLRTSFYITLFGNARERTITLRKKPADILDGIQCYAGYLNNLVCRSPFRWPARIVSQKMGLGGTPLTRLISYSPFPANLDLDPVVQAGAPYYKDTPLPEDRPVTIEVKEPLAWLCRDVEVRNLYLDVPQQSDIK